MKALAPQPKPAAPKAATSPVAPVQVLPSAVEETEKESDEERDARMSESLIERATRPVQMKRAVNTGFGDLVGAARETEPIGALQFKLASELTEGEREDDEERESAVQRKSDPSLADDAPVPPNDDEQALQRKDSGADAPKAAPTPSVIHEIARAGVEGASEPLPHLDRIQPLLAPHDLSGVRTKTGGAAAEANARLGALGYTMGERIAFRSAPDVKLAAHEAAHVVQQRQGVSVSNGLGRVGDDYERNADAVAEASGRWTSSLRVASQSESEEVHRQDRSNGGVSVQLQAASNPTAIAPQNSGVANWFPNLGQQGQAEATSLTQQGLANPQSRLEAAFNESSQMGGGARAEYVMSVGASGQTGRIQSNTTVRLDYQPDRSVSVVGAPTIRINSEQGLGPVSQRPAYPYVLSYSRAIDYSDAAGRAASVEVSGQVYLSEEQLRSQTGNVAKPSFEALLKLLGNTGYVTASLRGTGPITGYFASYAAVANSLQTQTTNAAALLGSGTGFSMTIASRPATFLYPALTAGDQYSSLQAFLVAADAAELQRRAAQDSSAAAARSWLRDVLDSLGSAVASVLEPIVHLIDEITSAVQELWNSLPPWARGILTAVGKFVGAIAVMAAIAGLIVAASEGAIAFGIAMAVVGLVALAIGFVSSFGNRLVEAWNSDSRWNLLKVPLVALLDTIGLAGIIESITNESILTEAPLNRSEEQRWETGTTGALQLVGIFLLVRGALGGSTGETVQPQVRGNMADFNAMPASRLSVLPEGHYWVKEGGQWVIYRDATAPNVPLELSIYSDGRGRINFNMRSGDLSLQSEAMTRPPRNMYQGGENRLPVGLREVGARNPYRDPNTGLLYEKGHGVDYADRLEGPNVRSSNADLANFTPQARYWNGVLRNQLVQQIRAQRGGYREIALYDANPPRTANLTPIPKEFIFIETSPTGQAIRAWRIVNDPRISSSPLPQTLPPTSIPRAIIKPSGALQPPGTIIAPGVVIGGELGGDERKGP